jgi:hypothetical protein
MNRLLIPETLKRKAVAHLFQDGSEHFLFFLCTLTEENDGAAFNADDVVLVDDQNLTTSGFSLEIQLPELIRIMNIANGSGKTLVEGHNHPRGFNSFSFTDLRGFSEFVPYVLDTIRQPYGATVWDEDSVIGVCWKKDASKPEKMIVTPTEGTNTKSGKKQRRRK